MRFFDSWETPAKLAACLTLLLGLGAGLARTARNVEPNNPALLADDDSQDACSTPSWSTPGTVEASEVAKATGGDIVPVRSVADPYPSFHSVTVDPENNEVLMSDSNRGGLLVYDRAAGTPLNSTSVTEPLTQVRGPATGMMFVAGVASDPRNRELFAVNNDIGDRMEVFPYDAEGNVKPKRILFVPHGSWGVALNRQR